MDRCRCNLPPPKGRPQADLCSSVKRPTRGLRALPPMTAQIATVLGPALDEPGALHQPSTVHVSEGSRAPAWSITAHGRCSLNSGRSLFPVETVVECQNGHLIEWLKPTPSNDRRTGGLNLKAIIRRRKPAAAPHRVGRRASPLFLR